MEVCYKLFNGPGFAGYAVWKLEMRSLAWSSLVEGSHENSLLVFL